AIHSAYICQRLITTYTTLLKNNFGRQLKQLVRSLLNHQARKHSTPSPERAALLAQIKQVWKAIYQLDFDYSHMQQPEQDTMHQLWPVFQELALLAPDVQKNIYYDVKRRPLAYLRTFIRMNWVCKSLGL
ncbi:hypothetical protein IWW55_004226, partial [Coemansia sp. RSA 2706]